MLVHRATPLLCWLLLACSSSSGPDPQSGDAPTEQRMEAEGRQPPQARFCWLALGSQGREEQLLRTDQDNALVFEDVPEQDLEAVKSYYLQLSGYVATMLNECGFEYCPAEMMASNPKWCMSLSEWKEQFSRWMLEPDPQSVMLCTEFFDYRPVYGLSELSEALSTHIFSIIEEEKIFLSFLAKNALENPPPLTFFRDFYGGAQRRTSTRIRHKSPGHDAAYRRRACTDAAQQNGIGEQYFQAV